MGRPLTSQSLSSNGEGSQPPMASLLGFPSPASDELLVNTPSIGTGLGIQGGLDPLLSWSDSASRGGLTAPLPGPVKELPITTPCQETAPDLSLDALVGATIDPAPLHTPSISSTNPQPVRDLRTPIGLKLPSFDLLGISSLKPDHLMHGPNAVLSPPIVGGGQDYSLSLAFGDEHSDPMDLDAHDSVTQSSDGSPKARVKVGLGQFIDTLTPPAEDSNSAWTSDPTFEVGASHSLSTEANNPSTARQTASGAQSSSQQASTTSATQPRIQIQRSDSDTQRSAWLDTACDVMSKGLTQIRPHSDVSLTLYSGTFPLCDFC